MTAIPRTAQALGIAGLTPFLWGALTRFSPALEQLTLEIAGPRFISPYIILYYGAIALAFMSGVLWGFAAQAEREVAAIGYGLSVIPALWAFLFTGIGPVSTAFFLIVGFLGVLGIEWLFWMRRMAPAWWMRLRVPQTIVVVGSLLVVGFG